MSFARPFDLRSALIGLGLAGSLVLLTSLAMPTPPVKTVRISLDPDPSSVVRVDEGELFIVPNKLRLVIKAVTGGGAIGGGFVKINGEVILNTSSSDSPALLSLDFPLVAQAGDVVSVEESFPDPDRNAYVTGYLAE